MDNRTVYFLIPGLKKGLNEAGSRPSRGPEAMVPRAGKTQLCVAAAAIAGVILSLAVASQASGAQSPGNPVTVTRDGDVSRMVTDLRAATGHKDPHMYATLRSELVARVGTPALAGSEVTYRHVLADLQAAEARHDGQAHARFTAELRSMPCTPASYVTALAICAAPDH